MKKTYRYLCHALIAAMTCTGFASCGNDDDDYDDFSTPLWIGELGNPTYEADAAAYKILNNPYYGMIELTASGNYIVTPPARTTTYDAPALKSASHRGFFATNPAAPEARAYNSEGVFGKYTKLPDGTYRLHDFGTLGVLTDGTIDLSLNDGTQLNLPVVKITNIESTPLNNRLCRTWYIQSVTYSVYDYAGNLLHRETDSGDDLREDFVQYVIVTKAGTFVQVDWDDSIESRGEWRWSDKANQVFAYSFKGYDDDRGTVQVAFDNDRAYFLTTSHESDDYGQQRICVKQINTIAR